MATIVIVIILLSIFHFVYESSIAPSLRMILRYKFFEIRDELRYSYITKNELSESDKKLYKKIDSIICSIIKDIPMISISEVFFPSIDKEDEDVSDSWNTIEDNPNVELLYFRNKTIKYVAFALMINSGGWLYFTPLLIPIIWIYMIVTSVKRLQIKKKVYHFIENLRTNNSNTNHWSSGILQQ